MSWSWCNRRPWGNLMEGFLVSTGVVAFAEVGDKTQLLALVLATRYRKPVPILLGILLATLLNHALAGAVGGWLAGVFDADTIRIALGLSFVGMAVWTLFPDRYEEQDTRPPRWGVFAATLLAFFLVEMGDKTQVATCAFAARYADFRAVVAGSTLGMMLANVPVVLLGQAASTRVPIKVMRIVAALLLLTVGVAVLVT